VAEKPLALSLDETNAYLVTEIFSSRDATFRLRYDAHMMSSSSRINVRRYFSLCAKLFSMSSSLARIACAFPTTPDTTVLAQKKFRHRTCMRA